MDYFRCEACKGVYQEGEEIHEQVSGRKGSYDNWLPDEDFYYCPHCETDITEGGCEEYGMEQAIDELQNRPTCEEVEALRNEVERLESKIDIAHKVIKESGKMMRYRWLLNQKHQIDRTKAKAEGENS